MSQERYSGATVVGAFIIGGLLGAGIALLTAPRSGKETRENIGRWANDAYEKAGDKIGQFAAETSERVKGAIASARDRLGNRGGETEQI